MCYGSKGTVKGDRRQSEVASLTISSVSNVLTAPCGSAILGTFSRRYATGLIWKANGSRLVLGPRPASATLPRSLQISLSSVSPPLSLALAAIAAARQLGRRPRTATA